MPSNGFWLKLICGLTLAAIVAATGLLWSLNGRVTRCEAVDVGVERRLARIEVKLDALLARP